MTKTAVLDAGFIARAPALPRSQDYAYLRTRGLQHIERLAHLQWTDYNVHDPGITILELLCYAITDLGLRAAYPMRDLLAGPSPGGTSPVARDFHLAHDVLVCNPVSFDDLRRLLIDIPGVRNAWVERHHDITYGLDAAGHTLIEDFSGGKEKRIELNGLFNVYLEYEDFVSDVAPLYRTRTAVGLPDQQGDGGEYVDTLNLGLEFEAREDARLESVTVYPDAAGTVVVRLMAGGQELARKEEPVTAARTAKIITLGFELKAGRIYRLDGSDSTVKLHRKKEAAYPMPQGGGPVRILRGDAAGPKPDSGRQSYYFFYNWQVTHDSAGLTKREVRAAAIERIHQSRNLCEDVVNVCDLVGDQVAICADVELRADADTDAAHAEILYRVYRHISPAVRFHSLDELLARGKTVDEIFDGPLLAHGFIDEKELKAIRRACEIRASDIVQILMDVDEVIAVKSLKLLKRSDPEHPADWILPLSTDRFRVAVFQAFDDPADPKRFSSKLTFYKRGLPYLTNRKAVEPLFKQKKRADVEDKLRVRQRELTPPAGEWRNAGAYEPIQNELPATYRVGRIHVPDSDPIRQAQSRQLTAYLMFFEQLLANYLAQLSHAGDLLTWRDVDFRTYFTQEIAGIAGLGGRDDTDRALDCSRQQGYSTFLEALDAIIETPVLAEARRLRFLEHLAARHGEGFADYRAMMRAMIRSAFKKLAAWTPGAGYAVGARAAHQGVEYECLRTIAPQTEDARKPPRGSREMWRQVSRQVAHERKFLADYPAISARRGTGFDWRLPYDQQNIAGYQRRVYRLLDIEPVKRARLAGHRFDITKGPAGDPGWRFRVKAANGAVLCRSISCEAKSSIEALLDLALRLGGDRANYTQSGATHKLGQRCAPDKPPDFLTEDIAAAHLDEVIAYFKQYAEAEGFHLIEHVLLRLRTTADPFLPVQVEVEDECCPPVRDPYSFRVSIVLPSWSPRFRDMKFRRFVEDTLRREAPAHIYPRICWINHEQMKNLEMALEEWQGRLASLAHDAGACVNEDETRTGRLPLPAPGEADDGYAASLEKLIGTLYQLTNVYPLAQIHDCQEVDGDTPQITLGNTNLGTL